MMIGGVFMALQEDAGLAWIMAVAVPLLAVAIGLVISRMVPWFKVMQEAVDRVNRILREQITGVRVVRAFVREQVERDRFEAANVEYTDASISVGSPLVPPETSLSLPNAAFGNASERAFGILRRQDRAQHSRH